MLINYHKTLINWHQVDSSIFRSNPDFSLSQWPQFGEIRTDNIYKILNHGAADQLPQKLFHNVCVLILFNQSNYYNNLNDLLYFFENLKEFLTDNFHLERCRKRLGIFCKKIGNFSPNIGTFWWVKINCWVFKAPIGQKIELNSKSIKKYFTKFRIKNLCIKVMMNLFFEVSFQRRRQVCKDKAENTHRRGNCLAGLLLDWIGS